MRLSVTGNQITEIDGDPTHPVSEGDLCLKGLYGFKHVADPSRLRTPLIRQGDDFVPVSWDVALETIAEKLKLIRSESGADAFALFSSAKMFGSFEEYCITNSMIHGRVQPN